MERHFEQDALMEKCLRGDMLKAATHILSQDRQSEEAFLGAQLVLMLHGKL
jgi:hypothetical protein